MKKLLIITALTFAFAIIAQAADYKNLYDSKCKRCHGETGEKKALNASALLQGQSADAIEKKIKGYVDGSYGGSKKGIMKLQAKRLDDAQIKGLAEYISTFK